MFTTPSAAGDTDSQSSDGRFSAHCVCVSTAEPRWSAFAVRLQVAFGGNVRLTWVPSLTELLHLRQSVSLDAVILGDSIVPGIGSDQAGTRPLEGLQTLLGDVPIVALSPLPNDDWVRKMTVAGAMVCVSPRLWDSSALPALIVSAVERGRQHSEWRHLQADQQRRKSLDLADARALLQLQQQTLIRIRQDAGRIPQNAATQTWRATYQDLLRASLVTGLSGLRSDIQRLVTELAFTEVSPTDLLAAHIAETEHLLDGLGARSSRQVTSRATLLAVEVLAQLGERYRTAADAPLTTGVTTAAS